MIIASADCAPCPISTTGTVTVTAPSGATRRKRPNGGFLPRTDHGLRRLHDGHPDQQARRQAADAFRNERRLAMMLTVLISPSAAQAALAAR